MNRIDIRRTSATLCTFAAALLCVVAVVQAGRTGHDPVTVAYSVAPDAPRTPIAPKAPDVVPGVTPAGDVPASDTPATDEPIPQG